jgi:hypothetical protein
MDKSGMRAQASATARSETKRGAGSRSVWAEGWEAVLVFTAWVGEGSATVEVLLIAPTLRLAYEKLAVSPWRHESRGAFMAPDKDHGKAKN